MFFNRTYFLIFLFFFILGITFFNLSVLKKEYTLVNKHGYVYHNHNLLSLHFDNLIERLKIKLTNNNQIGLPTVDLHTPKKSNSILNKNFPSNIKKWVPGYLKYPNGEYKEVSYRYRGDAFENWAYQVKAYKIKLKKNNLIDSKRVFNYRIPPTENTLSNYLPYYLGKLIDLPTPDSRFVEMRINGSESSILMELEHLDESFLRMNGLMPVNLYKGEQIYAERDFERGIYLFNNPSLWSKDAIFNQRKDDDTKDLENLISLIRLSATSPSKLNELKEILDIDSWAKFDALQTLLQSIHNDNFHNQRIISDIWRGKFLPVVYELEVNSDYPFNRPSVLFFESKLHSHDNFQNFHTSNLIKSLQKSSEFLLLKYQYLYEYLNNNLLTESVRHLEGIKKQLENSWIRDINKQQISKTDRGATTNPNWDPKNDLSSMISKWDKFTDNLLLREAQMLEILNQPPDSTWNNEGNILSLSLQGVVPLVDPVFILKKNYQNNLPKLYFDADNNGVISEVDVLMPILMNGNEMQVKAVFFANRNKLESNNTVFNLISDQDLIISSGFSNQFFNKKIKHLDKSSILGQTPHNLNYPIINKALKQEIWKGVINVYDSRIVKNPVKIEPGTIIIMHEGASLVFKNHVQAIGLEDSKIRFLGSDEKIWGTIAILGQDANGSIFNNVSMAGGSGHELPNIKFTGMFSLHDVKNVTLTNIDFSDNAIYDDLFHIVYGQNILLKNCNISNSFADAIDIDISQVTIENCNISNSGNDGIDSMSSTVKIKNSMISGSADKGVSVGEASNVFILGTKINQNKIGIESKDKSSAGIYNSSFYNNKLDLNAYKKNWQYGGGGNISLFDNSLEVLEKNIKIDKHSSLYVYKISKIDDTTKNNRIFGYDLDNQYFINNPKKAIFNSWNENYED